MVIREYEEEARNLTLHVAVCAERYQNLHFRLERLERVVLITSSTLFASVLTLIATLLQKIH